MDLTSVVPNYENLERGSAGTLILERENKMLYRNAGVRERKSKIKEHWHEAFQERRAHLCLIACKRKGIKLYFLKRCFGSIFNLQDPHSEYGSRFCKKQLIFVFYLFAYFFKLQTSDKCEKLITA